MSNKKERCAIALRPQVHPPQDIARFAKMLDAEEFSMISNIFIPDIPGSYESIEVACASLAQTKRLRIGSGVIRLLEHEIKLLERRLETVQSISNNRFVLGIGTGMAGANPSDTISMMMDRLSTIETDFRKIKDSRGIEMPDTYVATLKLGIARRVAGKSTGFLLNFCSPEYAMKLVDQISKENSVDFSCYLKVFYSKDQRTANRLLVEEFVKYDSIGPYHKMFEKDGVVEAIEKAKQSLHGKDVSVPDALLKISLANPSDGELKSYVKGFRDAGITLPCVYPYFSSDEYDFDYRQSVVRRIAEAA